ncbi:hypothetical protein HDU91_005765 [Kappamyces sp. JEL0680]|nr:hypothetical protein HDU91_005765 [Kappamyces sp. JEL0680]
MSSYNALLTQGFLSVTVSQIASAEIICLFMFGGAVHLTYFAIAEGKLVGKSPLRSHYLNFIWGEWLDFIAHIVWMVVACTWTTELIYPGFELLHIFTSIAQIGIRVQMTNFMVHTMKLPDYMTNVLVAFPFVPRVVLFAVSLGTTLSKSATGAIPGFNFFALLMAEAISFLFDLFIVKYAYIVLMDGKSNATLMDLIWEILRPVNFIPILTFSTVPKVGYLAPIGIMIASAIYYTYRTVLVSNIDSYINHFKNSSISSIGGSKSQGMVGSTTTGSRNSASEARA